MKQFEEEKIKWEQQRQAAAQEGKAFDDAEPTMDEERERAWQVTGTHGGGALACTQFSGVLENTYAAFGRFCMYRIVCGRALRRYVFVCTAVFQSIGEGHFCAAFAVQSLRGRCFAT